MCFDIDIVARIEELQQLLDTVGTLAKCSMSATPHKNAHSLHMKEDTFSLLQKMLDANGSSADAALMKAGQLLSTGDDSICHALKG